MFDTRNGAYILHLQLLGENLLCHRLNASSLAYHSYAVVSKLAMGVVCKLDFGMVLIVVRTCKTCCFVFLQNGLAIPT